MPIPAKPKTDSTPDSAAVKKDTIKADIGRFADPAFADQTGRVRWNRDEVFASGAVTLIDLLDRIPEVTTLRSGWISTPQVAEYNGSATRVRLFYDDVELDPLDARNGLLLDLSSIPIWTLEQVTLERSPTELRIYLRSWRVTRTTAYTRTDISTGNENTNLYRGFYGKRYDRGQVLQLAAQQYSTTSNRTAGSGDALSIFGRVGIAKKNWSVDAFVNRTHPNRATEIPLNGRPAIPPFNGSQTLAYLRGAIGNVNAGPWLQLVASTQQMKEFSPHTLDVSGGATTPGGTPVPRDTADTTRSETQLVLSSGFSLGAGRLTLQERFRTTEQRTDFGPAARFELGTGKNILEAYAESDALRHATITDVSVHVEPLRFLALSAGAGRRTASVEPGAPPPSTALRANAAVRLFGLWLSEGIITSDSSIRAAPVVFDTSFVPAAIGRSTGITTSLRGEIWRGIGVDAWSTHWRDNSAYQPKYETRAELNYANDFAHRFLSGDFGLTVSTWLEYRSRVYYATAGDPIGAGSSKVWNALLDIRILRAHISYQQRNVLAYQYEIVPSFQMPRVMALYGVRWEFWN